MAIGIIKPLLDVSRKECFHLIFNSFDNISKEIYNKEFYDEKKDVIYIREVFTDKKLSVYPDIFVLCIKPIN